MLLQLLFQTINSLLGPAATCISPDVTIKAKLMKQLQTSS